MRCLICRDEAVYGDLCKDCWLGLKCFQRNPKLLGRAVAYLKRKGTLRTKKDARQSRRLKKLVDEQRKDATDRISRFEHAIDNDRPLATGSAIVRIHPQVEKRCPEIKVVRNGKIISRKDCPF